MRYHPLTRNNEFARAYTRGKSFVHPHVVLYVNKNRLGRTRVGITATKKIGNAVTRNRVRRRLREIYRLSEPTLRTGFDVVVVARTRAVDAAYSRLNAEYIRALGKLGMIEQAAK